MTVPLLVFRVRSFGDPFDHVEPPDPTATVARLRDGGNR
jgi:hypothetical protein